MVIVAGDDTTLPFDVMVIVLPSEPTPVVMFVLFDVADIVPPLLFVVTLVVVDAAPGRYSILPLVGLMTTCPVALSTVTVCFALQELYWSVCAVDIVIVASPAPFVTGVTVPLLIVAVTTDAFEVDGVLNAPSPVVVAVNVVGLVPYVTVLDVRDSVTVQFPRFTVTLNVIDVAALWFEPCATFTVIVVVPYFFGVNVNVVPLTDTVATLVSLDDADTVPSPLRVTVTVFVVGYVSVWSAIEVILPGILVTVQLNEPVFVSVFGAVIW